MRPVDHSGPVTGPVSPWVLKRKFQPGFRDEKRGRVLARNSKKQSKNGETQSLSWLRHTLSQQLYHCSSNGMLMLWKIQQVNQHNAIGHLLLRRMHPPFIPVTGMKCSYGCPARLPRSRLQKPRSWEPSQPALSYEHIENFTQDSKWKCKILETGPAWSTRLM